MSNEKHYGSNAGKGYYIALILCAAAIGITGYLYYRSTKKTDEAMADAAAAVAATQEELPVAAVGPDVPVQKPAERAAAPEKQPIKTVCPVDGETIAGYAMDCLSYNETTRDWRTHNGVDIAGENGTEVMAAADGTVYTVYEDDAMGMTVVISHQDDYTTRYASLSEDVLVAPGDTVSAGQTIGYVGETALLESAAGPHVHFSVSCRGESMDPGEFLNLQ